MDPLFIKAAVENGIGFVMALVVASMLFMIVKHILKQQEKILEMATKQNQHWQELINANHEQNVRALDSIQEANRRVKEENLILISTQKEHGRVLDEQNKALLVMQQNLIVLNTQIKEFKDYAAKAV